MVNGMSPLFHLPLGFLSPSPYLSLTIRVYDIYLGGMHNMGIRLFVRRSVGLKDMRTNHEIMRWMAHLVFDVFWLRGLRMDLDMEEHSAYTASSAQTGDERHGMKKTKITGTEWVVNANDESMMSIQGDFGHSVNSTRPFKRVESN